MRTLCDRIGPRPPGTPAMRAAHEWALRGFESAGLSSPRLEPVSMPRSWSEGRTRVDLVEPTSVPLHAVSTALSPPIPDPFEADVVWTRLGEDSAGTGRDRGLKGKVALVRLEEASSFEDLGRSQRHALLAMRGAAAAGAKAVLLVSTRPNQLLYRHVHSLTADLDPIPSALVAREDGLRIWRLLNSGEAVRVRIHMPNRVGPPYKTANVLADIRGSQLPDEIVLIGAHLDSWDMGTGCLDNAVNAALVMHVARSLQKVGARPRRTLRFVLFGAEELGLHGARAYTSRHSGQIGNHVAAIIHDMGGGPLVGYSTGGRPEMLPALEEVLAPANLGAPLQNTAKGYFFSDNLAFMLHGIPSLFAIQETEGYYLAYHSSADTFDKVRIGDVAETAATAAVTALAVGDMDGRLGAKLESRQVLAWLRREGMVRHFRFLGVWDSWWPH